MGLEDTSSLEKLKFNVNQKRGKIYPHLHSLKVGVSIIVGIKLLVSLLPGLVDQEIPGRRGEGGELKSVIIVLVSQCSSWRDLLTIVALTKMPLIWLTCIPLITGLATVETADMVLVSGYILEIFWVINYTFHTGPYFNYKDPMQDYRKVRILSFIS